MLDHKDSAKLFSLAISSVLEEYAIDIEKKTMPLPSEVKFITTRGLDVLIYFFEELDGIMVLSFDESTAINIAKSIDMDPASVDLNIAREIIAELGNMTAARTSGLFARQNINTNITPPSIFCGKGSQIFCLVPDVMRFEVKGSFGEIIVYSAVRLRTKKTVYI